MQGNYKFSSFQSQMQIQSSTQTPELTEGLQIKNVIFKTSFWKSQISRIVLAPFKASLSKQSWRIRQKKISEEWILIMREMQQNRCKGIFFQSIHHGKILLQISHCRFPFLKVLNLSHNPINSIEALTSLDAVNLQFIYLETNNITSIRSLGKINFPHLEQLDLSNNKLKQLFGLEKFKADMSNVYFSVELFTFSKSHHHHHGLQHDEHTHCRVQDIRMIAKLGGFSFKGQKCQQNTRDGKTRDGKVKYEMLKRQFQNFINESATSIKLTEYIPQKKVLNKICQKFGW